MITDPSLASSYAADAPAIPEPITMNVSLCIGNNCNTISIPGKENGEMLVHTRDDTEAIVQTVTGNVQQNFLGMVVSSRPPPLAPVRNASQRAAAMPRSAIREIMALASGRPNVIHLEVGEPDFCTPRHIIDAA